MRFPGEELVAITSPLLPHRVVRGYEEPIGQVLESVNGVAIRNMPHLVELLRDSRDEYLIFRFAEDRSETLVFRRRELELATVQVMSENGIPHRTNSNVISVRESTPSPSR
jgi:hypothetical protein